jgi:hypothetical protein
VCIGNFLYDKEKKGISIVTAVRATVDVVARLPSGLWKNRGSIPSSRKGFSSSPTVVIDPGTHPAFYVTDTGGSFPREQSGWGVKLTTPI